MFDKQWGKSSQNWVSFFFSLAPPWRIWEKNNHCRRFSSLTMVLKVPLLLILAPSADRQQVKTLGKRSARQCDRLRWESVARLTVNTPVKSDICFQSNPLSSLQQLPWKPQCHFPHCLDRSISWKLVQTPALLKAGSESLFLPQYLRVRTALAVLSLEIYVCACTKLHKWVHLAQAEMRTADVLRLTFTSDGPDCWDAAKLSWIRDSKIQYIQCDGRI